MLICTRRTLIKSKNKFMKIFDCFMFYDYDLIDSHFQLEETRHSSSEDAFAAGALEAHWALFKKIRAQFKRLFREVGRFNMIFEWPRSTTYWQRDRVKYLMSSMNMHYTDFDGCQMGLQPKPSPGEGISKLFLKKSFIILSDYFNFCIANRTQRIKLINKDIVDYFLILKDFISKIN